ncbi:MAG: hypothetical protein KY429_01015 [Actinobacteria bacterium]|nr:hypothetical protein [Actinomycetota bacterium]
MRKLLIVTLFTITGCTPAQERPPAPSTTIENERVSDLKWTTLAPAPTERTEVTAAAIGEDIYVVGGFVDGGGTVATTEIYNTADDRWRTGPDLPVPVNHAMAAALDGIVYVFGGYQGPGLDAASDRAFAFQDGRWREIAKMPEVRAAAGAATVGDRIYIAGGVGPGASGLAETMMVFDPSGNSWSTEPGVPTLREHLGVGGGRGSVLVAGGRAPNNLATLEIYGTATRQWTTPPRVPDMPTARGGIAAALVASRFLVAAGGEAAATFDEAEAFDLDSGGWISLPPMPTARHGLGVVAIDTRLYVIAGGPQPGLFFSAANEMIDLAPLLQ